MNYPGKFDAKLPVDGLGAHSSELVHIHSIPHHGLADAIVIPDAHLLFSGGYQKSGVDLIVSDHDHSVVVHDYFRAEKRPALVSPEGAPLDPKVIEALTGHVAYAQAGGDPTVAKVIGHVVKMTGSASVVRNGVTVTLNNGDNVYQNDVVQTGSGSTLGLVLIDGTTFNMSASARLMLNDMVYDPNSTTNTSLFTLVEGAASFVAGQVAKTGDMKVATPVATMGIRGTAVILDISSTDGTVSVSVIDQHDGQVHAVLVYNARGNVIGTVTSNGTGLTLTPTATFDVIATESNKSADKVAQEFNAFQTLLQTYDAAKALFPDLPQHTDANPQSPPGGGSGTAPGQANPGDTSPIKDVIPVDQPKVVPIPINLPAPTDADPKAFKTVTVTITVIKTIDVIPAVDKPNFNIPDQVKVSPDPSDTVAYVPGTAKIISAVGPAYTPAGLDLAHFINLDPATGHVSYDVQNFAFLKAGDKVVVTIGFDSSVGPVTFHEALPLTIGGVNDPPVIDHAALAVSQGGTVVLSAANVSVADPDNTSFTFTVANVTHGTFQTTVGGVSWVDATSFTSTDLAAGHVRFVHDGSVTAPTFSIQANDGEAAHNLSNVLDGAVTFANVNSAPVVTATSDAFTERAGTGSATPDTASGTISFTDVDLTDRPVVTTSFASATYSDAQHNDITLSLTTAQLAHVLAVEAPLTVTPSAGNTNNGSATWNYSVPDNKFDFLAAGEALTLTYIAQVDNNFAANNETGFQPFTITITGTNDVPVITTGPQTIAFSGGTSVPGGNLTANVPTSGTLSFTDVDLTDTHTVSTTLTSAVLSGSTIPPAPLKAFESALTASVATDSTGTGNGTISWNLADLPVYLADFIPKAETLTLTYTVTVTDSQNTISTQTVTVTITGTDSPDEHHDDHGCGGDHDDHGRDHTHIAIVANHWVLTDGHTTTQIAGHSVTLDGQTYLLVDHFGGGFQAVQAAIDAAHGHETVLIAPGTYTESKTPAPFSGTAGGLFINTAGLTLQGVKSDGSLITTAADAKAFGATIISGSQTDFGSNHFIGTGGNGTTIQGLHLEAGANTTNKLVEVWGDHVTIENNFIDVNNTSGYTGAAAIYLNDPIAGPVSSVNSYLIAGNELNDGIYVANGVGTAGSGISSDQRIVNNHFDGTFDSHTGIGTYDMVAVQGLIPGLGWQTESAQVPTISGNSSDGSVPFLFRMTDAILADFPTAAQLATLVDQNTGPDDSYAYLLTAGGQLQTHQNDIGSGQFYRFYVANSIDTLNLGVDSTPDKVYGGQRIDMLAGDKLIVQSGDGTVNSKIVADGLTVIASKDSDHLNLTLANTLPDGTPVAVQSITLGDYSTGHGANVDVIGNALNNVIVGNSGNNVITGGGGADTLTGGGGHDTFKFVAVTDSAPGAYDTITDFQHGVDTIDLSAIDANTSVAGDQAFGFTAGQTAEVLANKVTWHQDALHNETIILADNNGNTVADIEIHLAGLKTLTASDFIL